MVDGCRCNRTCSVHSCFALRHSVSRTDLLLFTDLSARPTPLQAQTLLSKHCNGNDVLTLKLLFECRL